MGRLVNILAAAAALAAMPAAAADFSFAGTLNDPNDELLFNFTVGATSLVTLRTYSYAGGTNAAGQVIARGGFDPILALFDPSGLRIAENDDGGANVTPDIDGRTYDTFLRSELAPGTYTVSVSLFPNFSVGPNLSDGFENDAIDFGAGRTQAFAFDALNVDTAVGPGAGAVPEPASWALMIGGFGLAGAGLRRRARVATSVRFA